MSEHKNTHDVFGRWLLTPDDAAPGSTVMSNNYSERTFFAGTLVLLFALCALFARRDRATLMLTGTCVVATLLAMAWPLGLLDAFRRLPGLDIGSPMRYTQLVALALPVLFAITLDRLVGGAGRPHPRTTRALKLAVAAVITAGLVASAVLCIAPTWFRDHLADYMVANGVDKKLGAETAPLHVKRELLSQPVLFLRDRFTLAFLAVLATWGLVLGASSGRLKAPVLIAAASVLVVCELGWHGWRFNEPVKKEGLYETTSPGLRFLQENLGDARFMRWGAGTETYFLAPNAPLALGLNDAQGFRAMTPTSYLDFMRTLEPNPYDVGLPNLSRVESLRRPHLGLLRVKYLVSAAPMPVREWPQVYPRPDESKGAEMYIYENPALLPRAFLVHKVHILPSAEILSTFHDPEKLGDVTPSLGNPFRHELWLEEIPVGMRSRYPEPTRESARVTRDVPGRVHIEVDSDEDSIVVLSEQYTRGWRAIAWREDGTHETEPVLRANHTFLAAPVRKGTHSIEFVYKPDSFKWGGVLSGLAVVLLLLVPLIGVLATPEPRI